MNVEAFLLSLSEDKRLKVSTLSAYENDLRQFDAWHRKNRRKRFDVVTAQAFLDSLTYRKPSAVRRAGASLHRLYKHYGVDIPHGAFRYPERSEPFSRWLTDGSIANIGAELSGVKPRNVRDEAIFQLLYVCAIRVSELVALNLNEIRLKEKLIRPTGKQSVTRVIPMGGAAFNLVEQWVKTERKRFLVHNGVRNDSQALFVNRLGQRIFAPNNSAVSENRR